MGSNSETGLCPNMSLTALAKVVILALDSEETLACCLLSQAWNPHAYPQNTALMARGE